MFELERFVALGALELAEDGALVVADHVPLQSVDVGESLVANFARLEPKGRLLGRGILREGRIEGRRPGGGGPRYFGPANVTSLNSGAER